MTLITVVTVLRNKRRLAVCWLPVLTRLMTTAPQSCRGSGKKYRSLEIPSMLILKWARHWREKVLRRLQSFEAVGSFAFAPRQIRALLLSARN